MKSIILTLFLIFITHGLIGQTDAFLRRADNDEIVSIADIMVEGDEIKPTFLVTWSGEWCFPCMDVINSFGEAAKSGKIKLIAVNVDDDKWENIKSEGYHTSRWSNATNLYVDSDLSGSFDSYFSVTSAPLTIYFNTEGNIEYMHTSYNIRAWMFTNYFGKELIWESSSELNSVSWNYFQENESEGLISSENEEMSNAIEMIQRSLELDKNYFNTDTYAALLYLSGQYTKALKVAKEAIDLAKANEDDYDTTNELIQKIIGKM